MIIIGNPEDYERVAGNCDGRCVSGYWCVFADGTGNRNCPIDNDDNFIVVVEDKRKNRGLVVE